MSISTIGAYEAKTHLPALLAKVEKGDSVIITKHGRPVARLVPVSTRSPSPDSVVAELRAARVGVHRQNDSVRDMIDEGRR
jgi:prevent-host-death family protein